MIPTRSAVPAHLAASGRVEYVRSRSLPVQPYFDSDFPHGRDQFISAAATNRAVMALAPAAR